MFGYILLCALILCPSFVFGTTCEPATNKDTPETTEIRLRSKLLCNYDKLWRPIKNQSEEMNISVWMDVKEIDVSSSSSTNMHVQSEITVSWTDIHLTWDPQEYESINQIYMNTDDIWMPSLKPEYKEGFSGMPEILESTECEVSSSGEVTCTVSSSHRGPCDGDLTEWPHDTHICALKFVTWSHDYQHVFMFPHDEYRIRTDNYNNNSEWQILETDQMSSAMRAMPRLQISEMYFQFTVKRSISDFGATVVVPGIGLMTMVLMSFWLFPGGTDRLVLGCMSIGSHILYLQDLSYVVPKAGDSVPNVLAFYRDSLAMAAAALIEFIIFKKILTSETKAPVWVLLVDKFTGNEIVKKVFVLDVTPIKDFKDEEHGSETNEIRLVNRNNQMEKLQAAKVTDRLCFFIFSFVYIIKLFIMLRKM